MRLCSWCLEPDDDRDETARVTAYPIGRPTGTQRDPVDRTIDLCGYCINSLETDDLQAFYRRYKSHNEIHRSLKGEDS